MLLVVDALRPDHLGCYGYARPTSPAMDRLAARSVFFEEAVAVSSWTKPSVPSLLTGLYPSEHGVFEGSRKEGAGPPESDVLGEEASTLAERLREAGYRTAAFVHNAQLRGAFGFAQGFESYRELESSAPDLVREALAWLDEVRREGPRVPFFVYLHLLDTHWPYEPPAEAAAALGAAGGSRPDDYALREAVNRGLVSLSEGELREIVLRYDAEVLAVDRAVARLVEGLERRGVFDPSVFVLTSDHGEAFLEHGRLGHGADLYEESLRVPLLLKLPGGRGAGRRVPSRVATVDLVPTILELVGIGFEKGRAMEGRSLSRFLGGSAGAGSEPTFAELRHGSTVRQAVVLDGWKLVKTIRAERGPGSRGSSPGPEPLRSLVGLRLEIEGMRIGEDRFLASEIEVESAGDDDDEVSGRLERVDRKRGIGLVAGFEADLSRAVLLDERRKPLEPGALAPGRAVKLDGRAVGPRRFEARRVLLLEEDVETEIEGLVRAARPAPRNTVELLVAGLWVSARRGLLERAGAMRAPARSPSGPEIRLELYDLARDRQEKNDLSKVESEALQKLLRVLERWEEEVASRAHPRAGRVLLDDETLGRLRALGYVR